MWREQIDDAAFPSPNGGPTGGDKAVAGKVSDDEAADRDAPEDTATDDVGSGDAGTGERAAEDAAAEDKISGGAEKEARKGHNGIRRVLAEARAYVDSPPPLGRVRSSFASGDARTLRADGPGWSLVARTDDIAFVLLDDEPGEVLPVGRGPELPGLLEALDKMAVRPS